MTTGFSTFQPTAEVWACQTLDIKSTDSVQRTPQVPQLLALITQSDYVLSVDQANAAQIATESASPDRRPLIGSESISLWRNEQGSQAIAEFKAVYFDLTCDERSRRWQWLVNEYADQPDLKLQLLRLERGLQISMPSGDMNSRQQYLLRTCRNVFLGSPSTAAGLRRIFCQQWSADDTWEDAVDEALENYGDVLEGIAPWIDEFGDQHFWESQKSKPRPVLTNLIEAEVSRGERMTFRPDLRPRASPPELPVIHPSAPGDWWSILFIGITASVIIIATLVLLFEGGDAVPVDIQPRIPLPPRPAPPFR